MMTDPEPASKPKLLHHKWHFCAVVCLGLGLSGFIPGTPGVTWTMPLWLAIALTVVGGIGVYVLRWRPGDPT